MPTSRTRGVAEIAANRRPNGRNLSARREPRPISVEGRPPTMSLLTLDHVQLGMPAGEEARARAFYGELLGLRELPKPPVLARRGGVWFALGEAGELHVGVDDALVVPKKAHPGLVA